MGRPAASTMDDGGETDQGDQGRHQGRAKDGMEEGVAFLGFNLKSYTRRFGSMGLGWPPLEGNALYEELVPELPGHHFPIPASSSPTSSGTRTVAGPCRCSKKASVTSEGSRLSSMVVAYGPTPATNPAAG